jgi:hypothetical protein
LLGHTGTVSINPALYKGLKFDARKDLAPVAMFASSALVLVVPAASKIRTIADLVAEAKAKPGMHRLRIQRQRHRRPSDRRVLRASAPAPGSITFPTRAPTPR